MGCCSSRESKLTPSTNEEFLKSLNGISYRSSFVKSIEGDIDQYYEISDKLGDTNYSTVYKAIDKRTGITRAIKFISKLEEAGKTFSEEIQIVKNLVRNNQDHPNIVKVIEFYENEFNYHLVTEYCSGDDLLAKVHQDGMLSEHKAARYMYQIL